MSVSESIKFFHPLFEICYPSFLIFFQNKLRDNINVIYNTSLPVIFGIPKYAAALNEIVRER